MPQRGGSLLGDGIFPRDATGDYVLDIVIPVYYEEVDLPGSIRRLHRYRSAEVPYSARIAVADNASTDNTLAVARQAR